MTQPNLSVLGNTPFSYTELRTLLSGYAAPKNKAQELERQNTIIRLKKGYYTLSPECSGLPVVPELIANHLHAPSYLSTTSALRHYGLIPERVVAMTSVTSARTVEYNNAAGYFYYTHVPKEYYPIGITIGSVDNTNFLIATPEKALCDLIVTTRNLRLRSVAELRRYLEDDIRIDMDGFMGMDPEVFLTCAAVSQKRDTIRNLAKLIKQ